MATLAPPLDEAAVAPPPKRPRVGSSLLLWVILAFVLAFIGWAAFAELDRVVRGQGRVISSSRLQVVSNPEGGVVEAILVRQGQDVQRGQPLIRLDPTATGSDLAGGSASLAALDAKIARLSAEVDGREPVYPRATDPSGAEAIAIERSLRAARIAELQSTLAAGEARARGAERAVAEAEAAATARRAAERARRAELAVLRPLVDRGIEPRQSVAQAESALAVATSESAEAVAGAARARAGVAEARAATAQARGDWRAQAATELAAAQAERAARRATLPALRERVQRTTIRSPLRGRVNRVLVTTVGAAAAPGAALMEIVPSEDSLLVEARVRPDDIAAVRLDGPARVNITAYDPAIYGPLDGRVISISPDAVVDENTGESFYLVQVRTSGALRDAQGRPLPIGPGMVAEASLLGGKRTILQYLLTPITKMRDEALRE